LRIYVKLKVGQAVFVRLLAQSITPMKITAPPSIRASKLFDKITLHAGNGENAASIAFRISCSFFRFVVSPIWYTVKPRRSRIEPVKNLGFTALPLLALDLAVVGLRYPINTT
jgi:hypothetical protein